LLFFSKKQRDDLREQKVGLLLVFLRESGWYFFELRQLEAVNL
jgi:hypothetical protein